MTISTAPMRWAPDQLTLGQQNTTLIDRLCALLFALTPICQHYYGLVENAGFTIYLIVFGIMLLRLFAHRFVRLRRLRPIIPLVLFELYTVVVRLSSSFSRIFSAGFIIAVMALIFLGCLNLRYVFRYATVVGCIATYLVVIQYFCYYVLHRPVNFEPHGWLLPENSRWVVTIVYRPGSLYRPSGFFLEPSHIFLYCFPLICLLLLLPGVDRARKRSAAIMSVGVILSTSGMGIAVVVGLWSLYELLYRSGREMTAQKRMKKLFTRKNALILIAIIAVLIVAYLTLPFLRRAVNRIFVVESGTSAIAGRTRRASNYIRRITGSAVLWGQAGVNSSVDFSTSGFFATYIRWGVIGLALSYLFYVQSVVRLRGAYRWLAILLILLSFFTAHTHGTYYMLFFMTFLADGYMQQMRAAQRPRTAEAAGVLNPALRSG